MRLRVQRFVEGLIGGRALTLAHVTGRSKVHVIGTVATGNDMRSPLSPLTAAVLTWAFMDARTHVDSNGQELTTYRVLETETLRGALTIETPHGSVLLPQGDIDISYATPLERNPQTIVSRPSDRIRRAMMDHEVRGEMHFSERFLSQGDSVALRAIVEPTQKVGGGPYRGGGGGPDFVVVTDAEKPRLHELWASPRL